MPEGALQIQAAVGRELGEACRKHGRFASAHEGYAVILEEMDELWEVVKERQPSTTRMREEAIQVAAMAQRFILDVCPKES